jgi:uncharacterized membrane protein
MTGPVLVPRSSSAGVFLTWGIAAVIAVAIGSFVAPGERSGAFAVGAGVCLLVAFAVNLWSGRAEGFIVRTAASAAGGVVVIGLISIVFGLASIAVI